MRALKKAKTWNKVEKDKTMSEENIYKDNELDEATTSANFTQVRSDSTSIGIKHYNLDMNYLSRL